MAPSVRRRAPIEPVLLSLACSFAGAACAEEGRTPPPANTDERPEESDEKRKVPDYDGRGDEPTTTGDVLLWGPRILLAPPYLVSEYLLRRPIGFLIAGAERSGVPVMLYDIFLFG